MCVCVCVCVCVEERDVFLCRWEGWECAKERCVYVRVRF